MRNFLIEFLKDEEGLETVEMVIILVVIVGLAFSFRKTLVTWYNGFIADAQNQSKGMGTITTGTGFSE